MDVRIRALTRTKTLNARMAKGLLGEYVDFMTQHIEEAVKTMKEYPPPPTNPPKYIRTFTYRESWRPSRVRLTREGLVGTILSDAVDPNGEHYSEKVGGDEQGQGQFWLHHNTGWPLVAEVMREGYEPGLRKLTKELLD